jgi:hypothetical protein
VWGGNLLITKSDAFGSAYQSRPNGSASEISINAAMIFSRADFVNVDRRLHQRWTFNHFVIAAWKAKEAEFRL